MSTEQADALLALAQSQYTQDVELNTRVSVLLAQNQFHSLQLSVLCVVAIIVGIVVMGLLRPRGNYGE
jgi:hypothetical protein